MEETKEVVGEPVQKQQREDRPKGGEREKKPRVQRVSKYQRNAEEVTLETELPVVPKVNQQLKKPSKEDFEGKLKQIQDKYDQIKDLRKKKLDGLYESKNTAMTTHQGTQKEKEESVASLKQKKEEKVKQQKELNQLTQEIETLTAKATKYRNEIDKTQQQAKNINNNKVDVEELRHRLMNEQLTLQEEKAINKKIQDAKKVVEVGSCESAKENYDLCKQLLNQKWTRKKELLNKQKTLYEQMGTMYQSVQDMGEQQGSNKVNFSEAIKNTKEEFKHKLEEVKNEKQKFYVEYNAKRDAYEEEQDLLRYVEWLKRIQKRLRDQRDYERRQEKKLERAKKEEEEEKEKLKNQVNPNIQLIENAELLVKFLQKMSSNEVKKEEQQKVVQLKEINEAELTKEKLTVITKKVADEEDFVVNKKKGKGKQKKEKKVEEKTDVLSFPIQTLNLFTDLSVAPPQKKEDISKAIKEIEEKRKELEAIDEKIQLDIPSKIEKDADVNLQANKGKKAADIHKIYECEIPKE